AFAVAGSYWSASGAAVSVTVVLIVGRWVVEMSQGAGRAGGPVRGLPAAGAAGEQLHGLGAPVEHPGGAHGALPLAVDLAQLPAVGGHPRDGEAVGVLVFQDQLRLAGRHRGVAVDLDVAGLEDVAAAAGDVA